MKTKLYHAGPRGFTLIELLTVIAIIGILAAIIIPTVGRVRLTAKNATCLSNLRQVSMALRFYVDDNKGVFPLAFANQPGGTTWDQEIDRYLPKRDKSSWNKGHHAVMQCPSINWTGVSPGESGNCYSLAGAAMGLSGNATDSAKQRKYTSIKTPSISPWLADGGQAGTSGSGMFYARYFIKRGDVAADANTNTNKFGDFRHGERMNMGFADGSVKGFKRSEFLTAFPDNLRYNGLQ